MSPAPSVNKGTATPCEHTGGKGSSGGLAILVPTFLGWSLCEESVLLPGYAQLACLRRHARILCVINCYIPPGAPRASLLQALPAALQSRWPHGPPDDLAIVGDFNIAPDETGSAAAALEALCAYLQVDEIRQGCHERTQQRTIDRCFIACPLLLYGVAQASARPA